MQGRGDLRVKNKSKMIPRCLSWEQSRNHIHRKMNSFQRANLYGPQIQVLHIDYSISKVILWSRYYYLLLLLQIRKLRIGEVGMSKLTHLACGRAEFKLRQGRSQPMSFPCSMVTTACCLSRGSRMSEPTERYRALKKCKFLQHHTFIWTVVSLSFTKDSFSIGFLCRSPKIVPLFDFSAM